MRWTRNPSRKGCAAASSRSSPMTPSWRPSPRSDSESYPQPDEVELLEPRPCRSCEWRVELGEGLAAPEFERLATRLRCLGRSASLERRTAVGKQRLEAVQIERVPGPARARTRARACGSTDRRWGSRGLVGARQRAAAELSRLNAAAHPTGRQPVHRPRRHGWRRGATARAAPVDRRL